MKLIDILVRDLDKFGGWPEEAVECHRFVDEANIDFYDKDGQWWDDCFLKYGNFAQEAVRERVITCESESVTREQYEAALAASNAEWDGEGIPPVGTQCEFISNDTSWGTVNVIGIDGDKVVFKPSGETYYGIVPSQRQIFRPIRSEADKKRDEIILQMSHSLRANGSVTEEQLCRLYSDIVAGYIPHILID